MDPVANLTNHLTGISINNNVTTTSSTTVAISSLTATVSKSTASSFAWKVDVPEFVPRTSSSTTAVVTSTASSNNDWNAQAAPFEPPGADDASFYPGDSMFIPSTTSENQQVEVANAIDYVTCVISELQNNPDNADTVARDLLKYFYESVLSKQAGVAIYSELLEAALTIENFAFSCVRLMVYLHDHYEPGADLVLRPESNGSFVRDCLLDSLEGEFESQKTVLSQVSSPENTPRLFLFVNALCMFSTMLSIKGKPLRPLTTAVYEILERVVQERSEQYVRFAIQTLKTVGAHLETSEKLYSSDKTPSMDKMIDLIECIGTETDSKLSDNTKFMIRNLRGVRRHWAYVAPPPPSPLPAPEPVFYSDQLQDSNGFPDAAGASGDGYNPDSSSSSLNTYSLMDEFVYGSGACNSWNGDLGASPADYYAMSGDNGALPPPSSYYFTPSSLTPAEMAFFENAPGLAGGYSSSNGIGPAGGHIASAPSSDDDVIADAYEDFLRQFGGGAGRGLQRPQ